MGGIMQAILKIIGHNLQETPFERTKRKIADIEMMFENAVYKFARNCVRGELKALSRKAPATSFGLTFDNQHLYIKCDPGFIVMQDKVKKIDLATAEMYITSLEEFEDRSIIEDIQLDLLRELQKVLTFAKFISTKYNMPF
jgi:hypothetical protein